MDTVFCDDRHSEVVSLTRLADGSGCEGEPLRKKGKDDACLKQCKMLPKTVARANDKRDECVGVVLFVEARRLKLLRLGPHFGIHVDRNETAEHASA